MPAMIVCPQPLAAEAGLAVLRRGGNAVDAAVTTAFCQGAMCTFRSHTCPRSIFA